MQESVAIIIKRNSSAIGLEDIANSMLEASNARNGEAFQLQLQELQRLELPDELRELFDPVYADLEINPDPLMHVSLDVIKTRIRELGESYILYKNELKSIALIMRKAASSDESNFPLLSSQVARLNEITEELKGERQ